MVKYASEIEWTFSETLKWSLPYRHSYKWILTVQCSFSLPPYLDCCPLQLAQLSPLAGLVMVGGTRGVHLDMRDVRLGQGEGGNLGRGEGGGGRGGGEERGRGERE